MRLALTVVVALTVAVGCGDDIEPEPPVIQIASPARGLLSDATTVTVSGTVTSPGGKSVRLEINGSAVTVAGGGAFSVDLELPPGANAIDIVATDGDGATARDVRSVSAGPLAAPAPIGAAFTYRFGFRGLREVSAVIEPTIDHAAVAVEVAGGALKNAPVAACPGQNDVVTIESLSIPTSQFGLIAKAGNSAADLIYSPIAAELDVSYPDSSCVQTQGSLSLETLEVHVGGDVELIAAPGAQSATILDIVGVSPFNFFDHPVLVTGDVEAGAVFDRVVGSLAMDAPPDALRSLLEVSLGAVTVPELELRIEQWMASLERSQTIGVAGVDLDVSLDLVATTRDATTISFTLASEVSAGSTEPAYVATPTAAPEVPEVTRGVGAIADDAINQALGVAWRSGGFDRAQASGVSGFELLVPPSLRTDRADGAAVITIAGLIADLGDGRRATVFGEVELAPTAAGTDIHFVTAGVELSAFAIEGRLNPAQETAVVNEVEAIIGPRIDALLAPLAVPFADMVGSPLVLSGANGYLSVVRELPSP